MLALIHPRLSVKSVKSAFIMKFHCLQARIGKPRMMPLYGTIPGTVVNKATDLLGMPHRFQIVGWGPWSSPRSI